jgi:hypothetical protein
MRATFVGGSPTPANCNGVTVPCNHGDNGIGEIALDLDAVTAAASDSTPLR